MRGPGPIFHDLWPWLALLLNGVLVYLLVRMWRRWKALDRDHEALVDSNDQLLIEHARVVRAHDEVADKVAFTKPWPTSRPNA